MMQSTEQPKEIFITPPEKIPAQAASLITLVWSDSLEIWEGHANSLQPQRLIEAYTLLKKIGALEWTTLQLIPPNESWGSFDALLDFHHPTYCKRVLEWYERKDFWLAEQFGFSKTETVPFVGMAEIAQQYVSATRTAVRFAINHAQEASKVVCFAGEQVHASPEKAKNGDIFNDVVLALLDANKLSKKVAFINLDAEHPTVIQEFFFNDPNIMTISLHEDPFFLYPGTGNLTEIGEGAGRGYNVNIPLPPKAGDRQIKQAFEQVIDPLLQRFAPNLLIMLGGPSAHVSESLAHLRLTTHGYQQIVTNLAAIAPRFVLLGGSGSNWQVSARLWALAVASLARQANNRPSDAFSIKMLHDQPIAALSDSMQRYVDYTFQFTLLEVQQHLFPLWQIPISIDNKLVSKNMASLIEMSTTEKKISRQTNVTENKTPSSTRLTGRDEDDELKRQASTPKASSRSHHKRESNKPKNSRVEFTDSSSIEEQEREARNKINEIKDQNERKEVGPRLDSDDRDTVPSSKKSAHPPQTHRFQPQRPLSRKRKRNRKRRRRSGGK